MEKIFPVYTSTWLLICLQIILLPSAQNAQKLDLSFGPGGKGYYPHSLGTSGVSFLDMAIDNLGRIVLVGNTDFDPDEANNNRIVVVRLNPDGNPDPTFPAGGVLIDFPSSNDLAYGVALDNANNIFIGGGSNIFDGAVFKVLASGVLDPSFGSGGRAVLTASAPFNDIAITPSGKIVVLGWISVSSSNTDILVAQFNSNGSIDSNFGTSGYGSVAYIYRQFPNAMVLQSDGKIVVSGYQITCSTNDNCNDPILTRFEANGKPDQGFGLFALPGSAESAAYDIAIQNIQGEEKILVSGYHEPSNNSYDGFLTRRRSNGNTETFGGSSVGFVSIPEFSTSYSAISVQADNKIILTTSYGYLDNNFNFYSKIRLMRRNVDGSLDVTFGNNGVFDYQLGGWQDNPYVVKTVGNYTYVAGSSFPTFNDSNDFDGFVARFKDCGSGPIFTAASTPATCGQPNGTATVNISSGSGPFTYLWNNGKTTNPATGLAGGTYRVTVTSADGCSSTATVTVTTKPVAQVSIAKTDATCEQPNGAATANVTNGVNVNTYMWSNGATTKTVSNLLPGTTYTVTVTDENGCSVVQSTNVVNAPSITLGITVGHTKCGQNNGSATVTVTSGPTQNLFYLWSNDAKTASISNLAAGNYGVTVTDLNLCTVSATVIINPSQPLSVDLGPDTLLQPGQTTIALCANGPYTNYQWSTGATTKCINVGAGTYTVTVRDAVGCTAVDQIKVGVISAVKDLTTIYKVTLAPNPATDFLQATLDPAAQTELKRWSVLDAKGRIIRSGIWDGKTNVMQIAVGELVPSAYILRLQLEKGQWNGKFIKQ